MKTLTCEQLIDFHKNTWNLDKETARESLKLDYKRGQLGYNWEDEIFEYYSLKNFKMKNDEFKKLIE